MLTAVIYLNKNGLKNAFSPRRRFFFGDYMSFVIFTVLITLAVAFVNGWTDAPNAIASCVSTRTLKLKTAVILAAVADFAGAVIIGFSSGRVTETVMNIAEFGSDTGKAVIALCGAMVSVVIWAVSAWRFGIPTSESHALIAGLTGASVAVNSGFSGIGIDEWKKVIFGLFFSSLLGLAAGFVTSKMTVRFFDGSSKERTDKIFKFSQIISGALMAFMHGAQDSQKFAGILALIFSMSGINSDLMNRRVLLILISSAAIAVGTATGGGRIIKKVGMDMVKLRCDQGFSADLSGAVCLYMSTVFGLPVSTTHTKSSALIGVGVAKSVKSVDWKVAGEMIAAWLFTFPGCGLMGWAVTCLFLKLFI